MTGFGFPELLVEIVGRFRSGDEAGARKRFHRDPAAHPVREPAGHQPRDPQAHLPPARRDRLGAVAGARTDAGRGHDRRPRRGPRGRRPRRSADRLGVVPNPSACIGSTPRISDGRCSERQPSSRRRPAHSWWSRARQVAQQNRDIRRPTWSPCSWSLCLLLVRPGARIDLRQPAPRPPRRPLSRRQPALRTRLGRRSPHRSWR